MFLVSVSCYLSAAWFILWRYLACSSDIWAVVLSDGKYGWVIWAGSML